MRIAIVHYHLRPGGVTKVIQNTLASLAGESVQTVVLAGEPPSDTMPVPGYAVVEALGYSTSRKFSPENVLAEFEAVAKQQLGGTPDVWHIHNHALGKNLVTPEVVYLMAQKGQRILQQIHDFAEDGRPDNYKFLRDNLCPEEPEKLGSHLYPQGTHVHYALINQRDIKFLKTAGVAEGQLHYLPNAVSIKDTPKEPKSTDISPFKRKLFLYPVRAIRRKNIGEILLWATLAENDEIFAIARAPKNPQARPVYDAWVAFAQTLGIPVKFAIGEQWQGDFTTLLKSAHALVTTSIAEGFGLAFLEPYLVMRPLVGRKLPEVTDEFERLGVDLSSLYHRVDVPLEWIGRDRFQKEVAVELQKVYATYGRKAQRNDVDRAIAAIMTADHVDFGRLNEKLQKPVIERLLKSLSSRKEIHPSNLAQPGNQHERLQRNRETVLRQFSLENYGKRLIQIYRTVADSDSSPLGKLNTDKLLDQFLAPERFSLLRT